MKFAFGLGLGTAPLLKGVGRAPQAFVTAKVGTWTDPTTWTAGADYPRLAGDTFTVNHNVTISAGTTARGGGTVASGKTLTNNGTLSLGSNLTTTGILAMGGGGVLDLNGYTVQAASGCAWNFIGSAGSRCTLRSTGTRGQFLSGVFSHTHTFQYCDLSGLAASVFGRSHTSAVSQIEEYCTFTDMSGWSIDDTSTNINAGFKFNYNHVVSMHAAADTILVLLANQVLGTAPREVIGNAMDGGSVLARLTLQNTRGVTLGAGQVFKDFQVYPTRSDTFDTAPGCMWYNSTGEDQAFFVTGALWANALANHYLYYDGGNHPLGYQTVAVDAHDCIFEATNSNGAADWFLRAANSTATSITNNLFLGQGTAQTNTATNSGAITIERNTVYVAGADQKIASALISEQSGFLSGVTSLQNNLIINSNSALPFSAVWLVDATAGQLDTGDYNGGYAYPGGPTTPPVKYLAGTIPAAIAGLGTNDLNADPLFADKTRALATWDTALGGPGTAAHAVSEMLKLNDADYNSAYSLSALMTWVGAGFAPTGAGATAYNGTGSGGANIGYRA